MINKKLDFDAMTIDELWQLHEEMSQRLSDRLIQEKRQLEERLAQLRRDNKPHTSLSVSNTPRERRNYPRVVPKYQNTHEPFQTWSGRGRQPRWLGDALSSGRTIEEFTIKPSERGKTTQ